MSELEKFLEENKEEILDVVSKELDLPKEMLKTIKESNFREKTFDLPKRRIGYDKQKRYMGFNR